MTANGDKMTELTNVDMDIKKNVHETTNGDENEIPRKEEHPNESRLQRYIRNFFAFFTVEPFLLCYILPSIISALAVQKLNLEKACRADLNFTEDVCSRLINGDISDNMTSDALDGAQILVADMTAWSKPLQSGLPAILILFVGAWSDRTGNRKTLMLVPILGEFISSLGLVLTTYYFLEWPLWVTAVIEAVPPALTGGWSIALMGSYSFIADVTTVDSRTLRVGIVAVIVTLGIPIGSAISGVLTEAVGYYGIFGISMFLYAAGFVHSYLRIHDVRNTKTEGTFKEKFIQFFHPRNVMDTLLLLKSVSVILVVLAHIVIIGPVFGEGSILFLYTLKKYSMDVIDFSLFQTYSVIMGLIGTTIAVSVFSKLLKWHDSLIGVIATASKVISSFVYAFAPTRDWFFSGPAFDFFGNSGVTAIRSLGTKVVEPDDVGKVCSLIGFVEAIVPVVYIPLYSLVYSHTLETVPGTFYVLGGIMTVPAFLVFLILYHRHKKLERDTVKDPEVKERYARDNDVTAL